MSTNFTNLVSSWAELCENQEKLELQITGKKKDHFDSVLPSSLLLWQGGVAICLGRDRAGF